jgi:transposase
VTSSIYPLSDSDWLVIKKLLPPEIDTGKGTQGGRPHSDQRKIFSGLLYWIRTGCQWDFIPKEYGCQSSLAKYLKKWVKFGVFNRLLAASLEIYDQGCGLEKRYISTVFCRAFPLTLFHFPLEIQLPLKKYISLTS